MNKQKIIEEIKRITVESNGKAPGKQRFANETGIKESDWYPHLWLRWTDAILEAGCQPNTFTIAYDIEYLIKKHIELIRELGHFPIAGELRIKNKSGLDKVGYVYLIKHGLRNEYKIGKTFNPLRREGELRLELPEKVQPIHYIETDDPSGVENYWHYRFSAKRKEGEWFSLTQEDVKAFKKWRRIH